jgi:hypothetical protein
MENKFSKNNKSYSIHGVNSCRSFWIYYTDALKCRKKYELSWVAIPVSWISLIAIGLLIYNIVDYVCH